MYYLCTITLEIIDISPNIVHINMNIIKTTLFALATLASIGASAQKSNWQLVWHEEFNEDGKLNEKIWNYENGFVRNHESGR